jgi:hypothetical protein
LSRVGGPHPSWVTIKSRRPDGIGVCWAQHLPLSNGVTEFSLDDRGLAGGWVKSYSGRARTGFVYTRIEDWNTEMLYRLGMVAECRPR